MLLYNSFFGMIALPKIQKIWRNPWYAERLKVNLSKLSTTKIFSGYHFLMFSDTARLPLGGLRVKNLEIERGLEYGKMHFQEAILSVERSFEVDKRGTF